MSGDEPDDGCLCAGGGAVSKNWAEAVWIGGVTWRWYPLDGSNDGWGRSGGGVSTTGESDDENVALVVGLDSSWVLEEGGPAGRMLLYELDRGGNAGRAPVVYVDGRARDRSVAGWDECGCVASADDEG